MTRALLRPAPTLVAILAACLPLAGLARAQGALPPAPSAGGCPTATTPADVAALPKVARVLKERRKLVMLAIGASSVSGRNRSGGDYLSLVEQFLETTFKGIDVQIVHRGVSGELTSDAALRIRTEVALTGADLVLWQIGVADAMAHVPVEAFTLALTETVAWLRSHDVDVALIGLNYARSMVGDPYYQAIRVAIRDVGRQTGVLRIGRYEAVETLALVRQQQGKPASEIEITETNAACMADLLARAIAAGVFAKEKEEKRSPPPTPPAPTR